MDFIHDFHYAQLGKPFFLTRCTEPAVMNGCVAVSVAVACIPCALLCPSRLHKAHPVVIKARQLDSAGRSPCDLISIDDYLKLI